MNFQHFLILRLLAIRMTYRIPLIPRFFVSGLIDIDTGILGKNI